MFDLSKAVDKMRLRALLVKLMNVLVPVKLLEIIKRWLDLSYAYIQWGSHVANLFKLAAGFRQVDAMSLHL